MSLLKWDKLGLFVGGMIFATKGVELLASKTAHKVYVQTTAAALRGRDGIMTNVTTLRENCEDIYAEAVELNELKAAEPTVEAEIIEDKSKDKPTKRAVRKSNEKVGK